MAEEQIIYPTRRLLANPRIFQAIADFFEDGPEWEVFADAFYDLLESEIMEEDDMEDQVGFEAPEVCFRRSPDDEEIFQVILATGTAMELRPTNDDSSNRRYGLVSSEDELGVTGAIYGRLVKAIEEVRPDLAGNIALCSPPTAANGFLRSENGENFAGEFHLLTDPSQLFTYTVDVVDLGNDELKATVKPK